MFGVNVHGLARRMVMRDVLSHHEAARRFGDRPRDDGEDGEASGAALGYQRTIPVHRPKLSDHVDFIEQVLDADETAPAKR